jgi:amidase
MTLADETRWLDATDQAALVASGDATPLELLDAAIERIERLDPALNAVNISWFGEAREVAADPDLPGGPFRGVPFLLKDLFAEMAGTPMTNGNAALAELMPRSTFDSDLVARYKAAGLVIAGRTASPEFGSLPVTESVPFGATRNPWALDRTPGGSSGGAAAAVASGMVPVAHASDGGGSIRIPASCCGLFGLKPTQGRITMAPNGAETAVAVNHVVARSVRDSALMLDATHGPGVGDALMAPPPRRPYIDEVGADPGSLRIGLLDHDPRGVQLDDAVIHAVRSAAEQLEALGHRVEPGHPEALGDAEVGQRYGMSRSPVMTRIVDALAETIGRECTTDDVEAMTWAQVEMGRTMSALDLVATAEIVQAWRRKVHQWWADGWDLLLTPTLAAPPLPIGGLYGDQGDGIDPDNPMAPSIRSGRFVAFTPQFNASGQPAINMPLHWNDAGLPIGVQLVAAYGREDVLIRIASQLEAAAPWADRHPPT